MHILLKFILIQLCFSLSYADLLKNSEEPFQHNTNSINKSITYESGMIVIPKHWKRLERVDLNLTNISGDRINPVIHLGEEDNVRFDTIGVPKGLYLLNGQVNGLKVYKQVFIK